MAHITRLEAVKTLYDLINSGIINEELEVGLVDIANCIEQEIEPNEEDEFPTLGINMWGADDDIDELFVPKANPYTSTIKFHDGYKEEYEKWLIKCHEIYNKYKIK